MIRILVISTKGCEACKLTITNLINYIKANNLSEVQLETKDISEIDNNLKEIYNLRDFPTILLFNNNTEIINKHVGYISRNNIYNFLNTTNVVL